MRIHIASTINGLENEGMRNIATHLSREFEKQNTVTYSGIKDVFSIIRYGAKSDITFVFARLIKPVYAMLRMVRPFVKNICVVCVQQISDEFSNLNRQKSVADCCVTLLKQDVNNAFDDKNVICMPVGINTDKFKPQSQKTATQLKKELGFPVEKKLVLHVGHCSSGRGLEDMLRLDHDKYHCAVIASGMFDDESVISTLENAGIDVRFGFVNNIEDYYNAADVYLFPTKSGEFVISVPLSVMESLCCGTPVIAYKSFDKISEIATNCDNAVTLIDSADELCNAVDDASNQESDKSYLKNPRQWQDISDDLLLNLKKFFGVSHEK